MLISAGVETKEVDLSTYVQSISSTMVAMVGGATRGEVNVPKYITSPNQFLRTLGYPTKLSLATYSAMKYLEQGNKLWYVRVSDGNETDATVTIEDAETSPTALLTVDAKTPGTWGNNITVAIDDAGDSDDTTFNLVVKFRDREVERFFCSLDSASENYVEDVVDSGYIDITDEQAGAGASIETGDHELADGADGLDDLTAEEIVGTAGTEEGLQHFRNNISYDINILTAPDFSSQASVAIELIDVAEYRGDCIALIDPPSGLTPTGVVDWHNGDGGGANDPESALNSSYAATYWPWIKSTDTINGGEILLPPSGFVAGKYAYNDRVSHPWFAPAGLNRGLINAIGLEYNMNQGERDLLYGSGNAINPIVNFDKDGITIWGQRTLQRKPSALDRINVRRLMLEMRKTVSASTRYMTFEPNDSFTWDKWTAMVDPFMDSLVQARGLYDYKLQMDESVVTDLDIDQNRMPGKVLVKPTKTAEFIPIDFILYNTGAEFPGA